jgi:hypothetical protein
MCGGNRTCADYQILTKLRGYESYKAMQELASSPGGMEKMIEFFMGLQVWGTPEQCYKRIDIQERTGASL